MIILRDNYFLNRIIIVRQSCGARRCPEVSDCGSIRQYLSLSKDSFRLKDFLVRGCSANTADGEGLGPLHYASEFDKTESIEALYHHAGPSLVVGILPTNMYLCIRCILVVTISVISTVISTVDAKCKYGWTPLYTAVHHGSYNAMSMLLDMGADVNSCTTLGKVVNHSCI